MQVIIDNIVSMHMHEVRAQVSGLERRFISAVVHGLESGTCPAVAHFKAHHTIA